NYFLFFRKSGIWISFFGTLLVSGADLGMLKFCTGACCGCDCCGIWKVGILNPALLKAAFLVASAAFFASATLACLAVASSRPVAITVILAVSGMESSYIAPKIILASSPARFCT